MSDTPARPDEAMRLLDNDWTIVMFKSELGSYTAVSLNNRRQEDREFHRALTRAMRNIPENQITDDFTPSQSLTRLAAKVFGTDNF